MDLLGILDRLEVKADWIGLRYVDDHSTWRWVRDGQPQHNQRNRSRGIMVEVLADGQFAYAASANLDPAAVQQAAARATDIARAASKYAVYHFSEDVRPPASGSYISPLDKAEDALSTADLNHLLVKSCDNLRVSDKVVTTHAMLRQINSEQQFVSSNGSNIEQQFVILANASQAIAQDGPVVQKRSVNGMFARSWQAGYEVMDEDTLLARCRLAGEQAVELLAAEDCPDSRMDLLLAPDQMLLQIHESVGHPLEIDRILGDERNYAGWSFVRAEDFGELRYGSELMNITFDPDVPGQLASYRFDCTGNPAKRQYIIKDGILQRGLGGLESQQRSGLPGVANVRACSWNRAPIDRMANLNLEPGDSSLQDMVASVERGVYMESNRSWSIDDYRNKFQFGCEYARLIENGRLTRTLRNPNYRGISSGFWNSLKAVGNRDSFEIFGVMNCGKGEPNQVIRVGHASPPCLFADVDVFGGDA